MYNDPQCFASQVLSHSLLVVGYDLVAPVPFWILKNSWGTNWGEAGYMRMAIAGGAGICGINFTPVRYPVVAAPNPCGPINPCGGGTCVATPSGDSNTCSDCPINFMPKFNIDGSQSCAPGTRALALDRKTLGVARPALPWTTLEHETLSLALPAPCGRIPVLRPKFVCASLEAYDTTKTEAEH